MFRPLSGLCTNYLIFFPDDYPMIQLIKQGPYVGAVLRLIHTLPQKWITRSNGLDMNNRKPYRFFTSNQTYSHPPTELVPYHFGKLMHPMIMQRYMSTSSIYIMLFLLRWHILFQAGFRPVPVSGSILIPSFSQFELYIHIIAFNAIMNSTLTRRKTSSASLIIWSRVINLHVEFGVYCYFFMI